VPAWDADVEIDAALVEHLLGQFLELEVETLVPLSEGWDRSIWVVNHELAFGFPRRAVVLEGFLLELEWLPRIAPHVPVAVPTPLYVGQPGDGFPYPFYGSPFISGTDLGDVALDGSARHEVAIGLARFLKALHSIEVGPELRRDRNRRADMALRVPQWRDQIAELSRNGLWSAPPIVEQTFAAAERLALPEEGTLVHGDLHFRQIISDGARLTGVVDWVDVARSDASLDLQVYWSVAEPASREAFRSEYGDITEDQLLRSRAIAFWLNAVLANYGHAEGMHAVTAEAVASLERTASE
jgi:aminoglycoside phosphotransferase (APT) family kinase protein